MVGGTEVGWSIFQDSEGASEPLSRQQQLDQTMLAWKNLQARRKDKKITQKPVFTDKKPGTAGRDPALGFGIRENQALALTTSYLGNFKQVI